MTEPIPRVAGIKHTCDTCGNEFDEALGIYSEALKVWYCDQHMAPVNDWYEGASAPDMLRHIVAQMDHLDEGSPEQILYISNHLLDIVQRNHADLMALESKQLVAAHRHLEAF